MSLGVVMLVHDRFDRAARMVRHWADSGCPVVIHVDKKVPQKEFDAFAATMAELPQVRFSKRHVCDWGMWGLVAASQDAATLLLEEFAEVEHVFLASGSCLPLRPIAELRRYLRDHPNTDFIESATTADVPWTVGGLDRERFSFYFPVSWKKQRWLFDLIVRLQRKVGVRRRLPDGVTPHMGSQWWCLTRQTLDAILNDPERPRFDRFFRQVWIPDESYYQTLARRHSSKIESRSLTLSKFDFQGKPHIFFDDHYELLLRSRAFVARKVWHDAKALHDRFPVAEDTLRGHDAPKTETVDRVFSQAVVRRTRGRRGLYMQSRFPAIGQQNGIAAAPYTVLQGFDAVFPDFQNWLKAQSGAEIHGHLFSKAGAEFANGADLYFGALPANAKLRDYNAQMFLTNLIWNGRDKNHCFLMGPQDQQKIVSTIASDTNASIRVVTGAWAVPLYASGKSASEVREDAARFQKVEDKFIRYLRHTDTRARYKIWTLAEFLENPLEILQGVVDVLAGHRAEALTEVPQMGDLSGLPQFLQDLKNQGMHPFLAGNLPDTSSKRAGRAQTRKPYVVHKL